MRVLVAVRVVPNPIVSDVSPERSELLLLQGSSGETPYSSMPVPAGSPRRLGDLTGHDAAWAPNGKLVFAKGNDVYIAEHDGTSPRKLATAPESPNSFSFSPDQ